MIHTINLGAGVQSSCMALMAKHGLITPMPTAAIFSDTQDEPQSVYRWLEWLIPQLPFPVYKVTQGRLSAKELVVRRSKKSGNVYRMCKIPAYTEDGGMLRRKCTGDFKIIPLLRKLKELVQPPRRAKEPVVTQWIGISLDEAHRMKPAQKAWTQHRWPLIDLRMTRRDCLAWMEKNGYPKPPRSACVFCPYHNDDEWRRLKTEEPEAFAQAVKFEKDIQLAHKRDEVTLSAPFLHRSLVPLDKIDFDAAAQQAKAQMNLFGNECEGMCGN